MNNETPLPKRLARRSTYKGMPVPFLVMVIDGVPDFRVTDPEKWALATTRGLCAICGDKLGVNIFFIGGPKSVETRYFTDPGMHKDCAEYSIKVCPYLARRDWAYSVREPGIPTMTHEFVENKRPEKMALMRTNRYDIINRLVVRAHPFNQITWF